LDNPLLYFEVNLLGSLNLFEACRLAGVKRVVAASSAAVYGSAEGCMSEEQVGEPLSPYAASKLNMEASARLYNQLYDLDVTVLRFFNVYGPGQSLTSPYAAVIPRFIQSLLANQAPVIYGDGEQTRDFVHVQDVVQACQLALYVDKIRSSALNIASGRSTSVNQLASFLHRILPQAPEPRHAEPRDGEVYHSVAAIERAVQALGYRPEIALEDGLDSTVEWFRKFV
jgi:UDP-glucose 4-epimerase